MAEKARCEICKRNFKDVGGLSMHNKSKHFDEVSNKKALPLKKIKIWTIFILVIGLIIFGISSLISNVSGATSLPPTDMAGHIEKNPASHVLQEPMDIRVQRHMLEHADGLEVGGGIIINYDCKNFACEDGLIGDLESFAEKYPVRVYVAPFKNMPVKIALTKLGRIETLDEFDARAIEIFITGIIPSE